MTAASDIQVMVGIATRRRLPQLRRLLESLVHTRTPPQSRWRCLVVENDNHPQVESLVREFGDLIEIQYQLESDLGIPQARNRILQALTDEDTFVAFVDDDESVDPNWLVELLACQQRHQADVVQGRLVVKFEETPSSWISETWYSQGGSHRLEGPVRYAATNHVLVSHVIIKQHCVRFNEGMRFSGGSDSLFFMQLDLLGACMVFCPNAVVYDWIPPERANLRWLLLRNYRNGITISVCERILSASPLSSVLRFLKGMVLVMLSIVRAILLLPAGPRIAVAPLLFLSRGIGMIVGACGGVYQEYSGR